MTIANLTLLVAALIGIEYYAIDRRWWLVAVCAVTAFFAGSALL